MKSRPKYVFGKGLLLVSYERVPTGILKDVFQCSRHGFISNFSTSTEISVCSVKVEMVLAYAKKHGNDYHLSELTRNGIIYFFPFPLSVKVVLEEILL